MVGCHKDLFARLAYYNNHVKINWKINLFLSKFGFVYSIYILIEEWVLIVNRLWENYFR
jgi:hypothetical protein